MREAAGGAGAWRVGRCRARAYSTVGKGLYLVELSRRRLDAGRSRPEAGSHLGIARAQGRHPRFQNLARRARLAAAIRPCTGDGDAGDIISTVVPAKAGTHTPCRLF